MENVLQFFWIFCDCFGIQKYFLYSTYLKILKIEFHESRSCCKILKKLFLNSPYERVSINQVLDFFNVYLCFHRTFMKNIEKLEVRRYSYFFDCAKKLLKISKMNGTCSRKLIDQVWDTQLTYTWFPKDFNKYKFVRISRFFNIFHESPVETQLELGKI